MTSDGLKIIIEDVKAARASLVLISRGLRHFTQLPVVPETLGELKIAIQSYQERLDQYQRIIDELAILIGDLDALDHDQFPALPEISFSEQALKDLDTILEEEDAADTVLHLKRIAAVAGTLTVSDEIDFIPSPTGETL